MCLYVFEESNTGDRMSKGAGEAQYCPTENQTIHGTVQKIIQEGNKKTYVIVIKPNNPTTKHTKKLPSRPQFTSKNAGKSDALKKNLCNITDDGYDSKKSAADLFLNDDDDAPWQDDGESATFNKRSQKYDVGITKEETPVVISEDSALGATPSNLQFLPKHSAVRQIMMSSPDFQTTPEQQQISSVLGKLDVDSSPSPLASSTPISSSQPSQQFASPDSGIYSASSSILSQNMRTPDQEDRPSQILITKLIDTCSPALDVHCKEEIVSSQKDGGEDVLNTSLANIQWLGGFVLEKDKTQERNHVVNRMSMEDKCRRKPFEPEEIERICRECGRFQRPPYSYMVLIQLALSSAPDHKMTLKEICKWIEDEFEYFRSVAKPGWKNSIRHNLSFYHCFARDLSNKKKHGSKWMLQFDPLDIPKEAIQERVVASSTQNFAHPQTQTVFPLMPIFNPQNLMFPSLAQCPPINQKSVAITPNYGVLGMGSGGLSNKKRKSSGPLPILPRPSSLQAYALVPLQSVQQSGNRLPTIPNASRPIIVHVPNTAVSQSIPIQPNTTRSMISMQPHGENKFINIPPLSSSEEPFGLVRQAWIDAQCSASDGDKDNYTVIMPFQERPVVSNKDNQGEVIRQVNKKQKVKAGLPIPTIYSNTNPRKPKRTKSRVKSTSQVTSERNLLDSSDSECETDNAKNSDLPTPIRQLFSDTPSKKINVISTSTPVRNSVVSPEHLPSPIRGLTPVRCGNIFDGSFLDMIQEEVLASLGGSPQAGVNVSINHESPNLSLSEFGIFRTPPDKKSSRSPPDMNNSHGQSLCRFLAEFPMDSNIIAEVDGFPSELSLNWSNNHQNTDEQQSK